MDVLAGDIRAWDVFAVAMALGLCIIFQQLYFQYKLREKEREIQSLTIEVRTLRDTVNEWMKNPKAEGLAQ